MPSRTVSKNGEIAVIHLGDPQLQTRAEIMTARSFCFPPLGLEVYHWGVKILHVLRQELRGSYYMKYLNFYLMLINGYSGTLRGIYSIIISFDLSEVLTF